MSVPSLASLFAIGVDILNATRDAVTNALLLQTGDVVSGQVESDRVESWQHVGLVTTPSNPDPGKAACQGVVIKRGDIDVCVASRDPRGLALQGNMRAGEACLYAGGADGNAQARVFLRDDGSVVMMTTDNNLSAADGGKPVALRISPSGGLEFTSQWGGMKLDQTGFHVWTAAGPRIDMGGVDVPGVPAAVSGAFTGYCKITAPMVQCEGAQVFLGTGPAFGQCVQGQPPLLVGGGPVPLSLADISASALFASNTVWTST